MAQYGIDISKYQAGIDLTSIGADFVIVKATEGNGYTDSSFSSFYSTLKSIGKQRGVYHFARPDLGNSAADEASWFLSVASSAINDGILVLDYEVTSSYYVSWSLEWLQYIKNRTGVTPLFYTYSAVINAADWSSIANAGFPLWIANYGVNDGQEHTAPSVRYWSDYVMWQFTSKGSLSGWSGNLDRDKFFGDSSDWATLAGKSSPTGGSKAASILIGAC